MNGRQIAKKLRTLLRRRGGAALAALPQKLQEHGRTGEPPADPLAKAFVAMNAAALAAMDSSIGGADHQVACEAYGVALDGWSTALKESGV